MKANATKMTADQVKAHSMREYNAQVWEANVDKLTTKYKDVEFYLLDRDGYEYDRFMCVYTLPEGLRLMNTFAYSSCMTSGGFYEAMITDIDHTLLNEIIKAMAKTDNPTELKEYQRVNEVKYPDNRVRIATHKSLMRDENGNTQQFVIGNSKEARAWMTNRCKKLGLVYTKQYLG
jgi:hypothetical protein